MKEVVKKIESPNNFVLRLFVAGASANSARAISNIKSVCELYLKDRYNLEIIDVYQQPLIAKEEQLIALPLLIKKNPLPGSRLVGDMSDLKKVLKGLGINEDI
ncbi:circadian clock KaiB family protein [Arcticibacter eurypsychrophilus]|uniref:circadian clock KaiB family protein n=1 Tax=Arcticibacter eurypsychrophilus TaxID=1434752 RepID=UPI00373FE00D